MHLTDGIQADSSCIGSEADAGAGTTGRGLRRLFSRDRLLAVSRRLRRLLDLGQVLVSNFSRLGVIL
jgi:hypothetical protein